MSVDSMSDDGLFSVDDTATDQGIVDDEPLSLDGCLYCRRGWGSGSGTVRLRRRFVSLSLNEHPSLKIFKDVPDNEQQHSNLVQSVYSKMHQSFLHKAHNTTETNSSSSNNNHNMDLYIPSVLPWVVKDMVNDSCNFVLEIPATDTSIRMLEAILQESHHSQHLDVHDARNDGLDDLLHCLQHAHSRDKSLRLYFRCSRGSHEKALWLRAFAKVHRLSPEYWMTRKWTAWMMHGTTRDRTRNRSNQHFAQDARHLDRLTSTRSAVSLTQHEDLSLTNDVEKLLRGPNSRFLRDREFRVLPSYAYPHRWMTRSEMNEEMALPSDKFYDLRVPNCPEKEIGSLRVEVLQCLGLPKLDRTSDTDACVYLVCGSYAFCTDVIPNRMNPMWLRKSRRACDFPLFAAYARLYVGVFDDDGKQQKDDFGGRVVIDLARLRPRSTYDVTLPLRLSTHVYSRRKRGAIRLRFTLNWTSEKEALLSYIPKSFKIGLPQHSRPNFGTTVNCNDEKAFRNIAITVHGAHMPGRFTFHQMRASIRELNFTRRYLFTAIKQNFRDLRHWQNPVISFCIFAAWMHCIYANSFALVPAYVILFFFFFLMRNYAKYAVEQNQQTGFIPPSWEEMFMSLFQGKDSHFIAIKPLELGHKPATSARRFDTLSLANGIINEREMKAVTHEPKGKRMFRFFGFLKAKDDVTRGEHLEFPFSNEEEYPKFSTRECLVDHKGEINQLEPEPEEVQMETIDNGHDEKQRLLPRFPLDLENVNIVPDIMRRDSSGLQEYDEEEINFTARKAVRATGKKAAKTVTQTGLNAVNTLQSAATMATTRVTEAAAELGEFTGLNNVVTPIRSGMSSGAARVTNGVSNIMRNPSPARLTNGQRGRSDEQAVPRPPPLRRRAQTVDIHGPSSLRIPRPFVRQSRSFEEDELPRRPSESPPRRARRHGVSPTRLARSPSRLAGSPARPTSVSSRNTSGATGSDTVSVHSRASSNPYRSNDFEERSFPSSDGDPALFLVDEDEEHGQPRINGNGSDHANVGPEQNIDVEGPSTGKKLTDDLEDIRDKIHEMSWHLFDDKAYLVNDKSIYFGEGRRPEKRRKDVTKQLNKLLSVGQYSHSNPFVARVGLYVDPIIGSVYSVLCFFRASFNIFTWQDPMMTFWLSLATGVLAFVLFFFPWRWFLFVSGCWLLGPQNWVFRILRERGRLPPITKKPSPENWKHIDFTAGKTLDSQPLLSAEQREGNPVTIDPSKAKENEVHRVVVPFSRLMYQRFYDWPPEPLYAQVKPEATPVARERALQSLQKVARQHRRPSLMLPKGFMMNGSFRRGKNGNHMKES